MAHHPTGAVVEIVGTMVGDRGCSCEEHDVCGEVLAEDVVVRLRKVQVEVDGKEETAIAAIWVTDGIDRCRVGYLPRHMVAHEKLYDGALAQVTKVMSGDAAFFNSVERRLFHKNRGCCMAAIISSIAIKESKNGDETKRRKTDK